MLQIDGKNLNNELIPNILVELRCGEGWGPGAEPNQHSKGWQLLRQGSPSPSAQRDLLWVPPNILR